MLTFQAFFTTCTGRWTTERTYHSTLRGEVERSYTEFRVAPLTATEKQQILSSQSSDALQAVPLATVKVADDETLCPGFAIAFDTRSETGEQVSMSLKALFVPDRLLTTTLPLETPPLPIAAQVLTEPFGGYESRAFISVMRVIPKRVRSLGVLAISPRAKRLK